MFATAGFLLPTLWDQHPVLAHLPCSNEADPVIEGKALRLLLLLLLLLLLFQIPQHLHLCGGRHAFFPAAALGILHACHV